MNKRGTSENILIAHLLSKEALSLCVFAGFGFLVAEIVLPGIFSQRINFFFVYVGLLGCMGMTIISGWATKVKTQKKTLAVQKEKYLSFFVGSIFVALFFVPVLKNMSIWAFPVFALCLGMVLIVLSRDLEKGGSL